ncbi:hypothetical protein V3C99_008621, partial [Haemonchus contortus]
MRVVVAANARQRPQLVFSEMTYRLIQMMSEAMQSRKKELSL